MNTTQSSSAAPTAAEPAAAAPDVASHLRVLAAEADALLKATARAGDSQLLAARARLADDMEQLRRRLADVEGQTRAHARRARERADEAVHAHPYVGMAATAAVGLLFGFLLGRR